MHEYIGDILKDEFFRENPETTFTIPRFQRGYSWTTDHVTDFLNDLDGRLYDKQDHHFGTLFLKNIEHSDAKEIVDGQQRITTVVLYLVACRDFLKSYEKDVTDAIEKREFDIRYQELSNRLKPKKQPNDPILKVGKSNEDLFAKLYPVIPNVTNILDSKLLNVPIGDDDKLLLNAYKLIYENLKSKAFDETTKKLVPKFWSVIQVHYTTLLESFRMAKLVVNTMEKAFTIFETLNDRGEPLKQTDLIKNYFFGILTDHKVPELELDKFAERWKNMREKIMTTKYKFDDFVSHVLLVQYNYKGKKDQVFKGIQKVIDQGRSPQKLIEDLERWASVLEKLREPEKVQKWGKESTRTSLKILRKLRAVHAYPTLMQGYSAYFEKKDYPTFEKLAELLLKIQIRTKQILGYPEKDVSAVTTVITQNIKDKKSWPDITEPIVTAHNVKATKGIFEASLDKFESRNSDVVTYILEHAVPGASLKIPGGGEIQVEHIMPKDVTLWTDDMIKWNCIPDIDMTKLKKEAQEHNVKIHHEQSVNFIGNQMLLESDINGKIQNAKLVDKQKEYSTSIFPEAKRIGKVNQWTIKEIRKRQEDLKKTMITLFTCT